MKKVLCVKEWFARKISDDKKRKYVDIDIYAILNETEKAVQVMFASETNGIYTAWSPKSCLEIAIYDEYELGEEINKDIVVNEESTIESLIQDYKMESYEVAYKSYQDRMFMYR